MLQGKNIYVRIDGLEILKNVNINVKPSNISCLIGPSGSGKSTVISSLSMLSPPNKGIVTLNNKDYRCGTDSKKGLKFPYPLVTVVFQGLFLFPHLNNEKNILLPLLDQNKNLSGFDELIDRLKVRDILKKYPNECSGGEKQRVALARQILLEPQYLLLDEVTSALDMETIHTIADILFELRNKGMGILLATHMINLAKTISDDFYFIDKGEIIEKGAIQNLNYPQSERLRDFLQIL
ncbi:MAG: ATP-binding cassette domain-containing protein [Clostridia bacterium]|nr:ATP-binding cassette domain-containing protein [Clostridia bacterium]MDD3971907.1 ATP-binding cassette domain-containing protein [Clostridia bacterium]